MAWSTDPKYVYTKDPVGLTRWYTPAAITPDGSRIVFTQRKQLSTLYRSESLK